MGRRLARSGRGIRLHLRVPHGRHPALQPSRARHRQPLQPATGDVGRAQSARPGLDLPGAAHVGRRRVAQEDHAATHRPQRRHDRARRQAGRPHRRTGDLGLEPRRASARSDPGHHRRVAGDRRRGRRARGHRDRRRLPSRHRRHQGRRPRRHRGGDGARDPVGARRRRRRRCGRGTRDPPAGAAHVARPLRPDERA